MAIDIDYSENTKISEHLRVWNGGEIDAEITEELSKLVRDVKITGKKGTITLAITVTPEDKEGDYVSLTMTKIKVSAPEVRRRSALFYASNDGDLLRNNPTQVEIPLRTVGERAETIIKGGAV